MGNCRCCGRWLKMYPMPREPHLDLPPGFPEVTEVFGSRVRLAILLSLARSKEASLQALVIQTGINYNTMKLNLSRLEDLGAITCSLPRGQRRGKTATFSLVPAALDRFISLLHSAFPSPE